MADDELPDLAFVHLSDIHFRSLGSGRGSGDPHDSDIELRHELSLDLRRLDSVAPKFDALLVSGDIAFGGSGDEYALAHSWLDGVRETLKLTLEQVLVVPGNHDVDRTALKAKAEIQALHKHIVGLPSDNERDREIASIFRADDKRSQLLSPLQEYGAFASVYGCLAEGMQPFWERDFPLSDGSTLRLRGVTSTLVSGLEDDVTPKCLFYGSAQRIFLNLPDIRHAIMAHHPPSWTSEAETAEAIFASKTVLQLFGHRHEAWFHPSGNSLRIIAGAVHPDRREPNWQPRYNAITIKLISPTQLRVRVYARRWFGTPDYCFGPDRPPHSAEEFREMVVAVPQVVQRRHPPPQTPPLNTSAFSTNSAHLQHQLSKKIDSLGLEKVAPVARALGLPIHQELSGPALVKAARERGALSQLWEQIAPIAQSQP